MAENQDIKIFLCTQKKIDFLPPFSIPVQGGAKQSEPIDGVISDFGDGGDISEKNREYCELTVQYYAWKNEHAEYYGFCHYRRFFMFNESVRAPYLVFGKIPDKKREKLLGTEDGIRKFVKEHDVIIPRAEDMGISVREKYLDTEYCYESDLDIFLDILKNKYPYLSAFADDYMKSTQQYFCNMFIMRRDIFFDYCEILFSLLEEFDNKKIMHGNFQADRTDGYLAERFLGIYIAHLRSLGKKIGECGRVDTECKLSKRIMYRVLPPESIRRMFVKKMFTKTVGVKTTGKGK